MSSGDDKAPHLTAHGYVCVPEQSLRSPRQLDELLAALLVLRRGMSWPYEESQAREAPQDLAQLLKEGQDPAVAHFAHRFESGDMDELSMWKGLALVQSAQVSSLRRALFDALKHRACTVASFDRVRCPGAPAASVTIGHESVILATTTHYPDKE